MRVLSNILLVTSLWLGSCVAVDKIPAISDICVECLSRIKTRTDCIDHPVTPGVQLCGPFSMTKAFFDDCTLANPLIAFVPPPGLEEYKDCALDYNCSAGCVRAWHRRYAGTCAAGLGRTNLSCADYGRMHSGGAGSCGDDISGNVAQYLGNMTELCGCRTVYGKCEDPKSSQVTEGHSTPIPTRQIIIYVVPSVCGFIIVILIIVGAIFVRNHIKRNRSRRRDIKALESQRAKESQKKGSCSPGTLNNQYTVNLEPGAGSKQREQENGGSTHLTLTSPNGGVPTTIEANLQVFVNPSPRTPDPEYEQAVPISPAYLSPDRRGPNDSPTGSSPPSYPTYLNVRDQAAPQHPTEPQHPVEPSPMYMNRAMMPEVSMQDEGKAKPKAPIPAPREPKLSDEKPPPRGLYVDDAAVDDSRYSGDQGYVTMSSMDRGEVLY